jgi:hypothetical protein
MQFKPTEFPDMVQDELRNGSAILDGAVGINEIVSCTATCSTLTIGEATPDGNTVTFPVTATQLGRHNILVTAELSSSETVKGYVSVRVTGEPCASSSRDYD